MCELNTKLCHLVNLVQTLTCEEVQTIEICLVSLNLNLISRLLNRDDGLEECALTLLDILTHRVEIGSEGYRCREDTLAVLTLALAIKLLPPLVDVLQLWLIRAENLNLLARLVELEACSGILCCEVILERYTLGSSLLHSNSTCNQSLDIHATNSEWKKTYRGEYRETTTYIVRNNEGCVTLLCSESFECATSLIGNSHDTRLCLLLAIALLNLLLNKAESDSRLGGSSRLRDNDGCNRTVGNSVEQLCSVVLRDILTCEENDRVLTLGAKKVERVVHCIENSLCTEVRATDTDADNNLCLRAKSLGSSLNSGNLLRVNRRWERYPTQKIISSTLARVEQSISLQSGLLLGLRKYYATLGSAKFQHFHYCKIYCLNLNCLYSIRQRYDFLI